MTTGNLGCWCLFHFCICSAVKAHVTATSADDTDLLSLCHVCPMCDHQFDSAYGLQLHVNTHFDEQPQPSSSEHLYYFLLYFRIYSGFLYALFRPTSFIVNCCHSLLYKVL